MSRSGPESPSLESPCFGVALLWSRHSEMAFLSRGPRYSTTRCLEAGRPIDLVRAALIGGHKPNAPDVKRRSVFGGPLGPDNLRFSRANDDSLLRSKPPYFSVRAVLQRRTRTGLFFLRGMAFPPRRLEQADVSSRADDDSLLVSESLNSSSRAASNWRTRTDDLRRWPACSAEVRRNRVIIFVAGQRRPAAWKRVIRPSGSMLDRRVLTELS